MIDYTINIYSLLLLAIMVGSALYALGQWARKNDSARDSAASKAEIAAVIALVTAGQESNRDKLADLTRRITDLEHSVIRKEEFNQFQMRVESNERHLLNRLEGK